MKGRREGEVLGFVGDYSPVRERRDQRAERLLSVHTLRAADAFQLAAALIWTQESPRGFELVCLDQNLREAAFREGFTVLP